MKKEFGMFMSLIYACSVQSIIWGAFLLLYVIPKSLGDTFIPCFFCLFWFIEYLIFYRKGTYIDVFSGYERMNNNSAMKKKCRYAKLFNICMIVLEIIGICIIDYNNHH